jgi:predicted DNA-binding WGR domain protein
MNQRSLHYCDGKSDKFWTITLDGKSHTVHYGRVGTVGQTQTKEFSTEAEALKSYEKLVNEKLKKGYVEVKPETNLVQDTKADIEDTERLEIAAIKTKSACADSTQPAEAGFVCVASDFLSAGDLQNSDVSEPNSQPATLPITMVAESRKSVAELLNVTRSIELDPDDWLWATWRRKAPVQRREAEPFDKEKALKRLGKIIHIKGNQQVNWHKAEIAPFLSREEAHFWFTAINDVARLRPKVREQADTSYICDEDLLAHLAQQSFTDELDQQSIVSTLVQAFWENSRQGYWNNLRPWKITPEIIMPLANLLGVIELVITLDELARCDDAAFMNYTEQNWGSDYLSSLTASQRSYYPSRSIQTIEAEIIADIRCFIPKLLAVLSQGFATYVLPYCTEAEIEAMRDRLRPALDVTRSPYELYYWAAHLEMHDEVATWLQPQQDLSFRAAYGWRNPPACDLLFALRDPSLIAAEMRRFQYRPQLPIDIRACLAHMGYAAFDIIREGVLRMSRKEDTAKLLQAFFVVNAPEAASYMLDFLLASKAPQVAQHWLDEHPVHAILGLIPVAAGQVPQLSEDRGASAQGATRSQMINAAIAFLRTMKRNGYGELIQAAIERESAEVAESVRQSVLERKDVNYSPFDKQTTPEWLQQGVADIHSLKLKPITWVSPADLPPIVVGERCLSDDQVAACLFALRQSTLERAHSLIGALKTNVERSALDTFSWSLFERWQKIGAPSKEKWGMEALGLLGGDAIALKLTPLIRTWPGENKHPLAVRGLECLRAIGTDTALMQINGIAQKAKFKGIKERARECIEAIATDRNLTHEQLEDRIIPDCDLDEKGSRVFDFGDRQFRFVLGQDMKPMVRDAAGKLKADLPKPGVKDNPELVNQAISEWKLLKKQINEVVKIQAFRLEQAMVSGRRWLRAGFEMLLVRHPLMFNLVRLLVWGAFDTQGKLVGTFRVTEDQTYANVDDESFELEGIAEVGIVHPLHLSETQRSAWGELLSDYEIVPPFAQLGRSLYRLNPEETTAKEITRFKDINIPAISLTGTLEKLGWVRGTLCDHGCFYEHLKPFYGANVTAIVGGYEGIPTGMIVDWDDQAIAQCFFTPGIRTANSFGEPIHWHTYRHPLEIMPLSEVDPVLISEVLSDLSAVAAKGK